MMYSPRVSLATAVPVEMGDSKLMVVSVGDGFEVVAADSFHRLFRAAAEAPALPVEKRVVPAELADTPHPWTKNGKAAAGKKTAVAVPAKPAPPSGKVPIADAGEASEMGTTEAMLKAVAEGPRTTAETQDRVCQLLGWPTLEKKYRDRVYQSIWTALKDGKIEKRTDPATQLSRLYLKGAQ